jgi:hypothetical protein
VKASSNGSVHQEHVMEQRLSKANKKLKKQQQLGFGHATPIAAVALLLAHCNTSMEKQKPLHLLFVGPHQIPRWNWHR